MLNGTVCVISQGDDQKTDDAMENLVLVAVPVSYYLVGRR